MPSADGHPQSCLGAGSRRGELTAAEAFCSVLDFEAFTLFLSLILLVTGLTTIFYVLIDPHAEWWIQMAKVIAIGVAMLVVAYCIWFAHLVVRHMKYIREVFEREDKRR
ncbi:MAG: otopetrin domain-containing protein [Deltaproteobacteria bacterium]|jgi:hypothetical protein|nr:otopetrin domain-containing protein [Deltaproteobacteria bacterium]